LEDQIGQGNCTGIGYRDGKGKNLAAGDRLRGRVLPNRQRPPLATAVTMRQSRRLKERTEQAFAVFRIMRRPSF